MVRSEGRWGQIRWVPVSPDGDFAFTLNEVQPRMSSNNPQVFTGPMWLHSGKQIGRTEAVSSYVGCETGKTV